jgi:branched-chain amino acid transport system substrate-binding protein
MARGQARIARRPLLGAMIAGAASPALGQGNELRLGVLVPATGPLALVADENLRGLELAIEARSTTRPIRLLRGEAADPAQAQAEARRLLGQDKVAALFGTGAAAQSAAASQAAELAETPFIELGAVADPLLERGFRQIVRTCPSATDLARRAVEAIAEQLASAWSRAPDTLRLAVLADEGMTGQSLAACCEAEARARNLAAPSLLTQPARGTELAPVVQRLRGEGVEVLLHAGTPNDIAPLFRALREAAWQPRMVIGLGAGYGLADTAQALGPAIEGVLVVDVPPLAVNDRVASGVAPFIERYRRRYGSAPRSGQSLAAFAGVEPVLEALLKGSERPRAAFAALDIAEGGLANGWGLRFDERGQNQRAWPVLLQWQGGRLVTVAPVEAAVAPLRPSLG